MPIHDPNSEANLPTGDNLPSQIRNAPSSEAAPAVVSDATGPYAPGPSDNEIDRGAVPGYELLEPLGHSQVWEYLRRLACEYRIFIVSFEKPADLQPVRGEQTQPAFHPFVDLLQDPRIIDQCSAREVTPDRIRPFHR